MCGQDLHSNQQPEQVSPETQELQDVFSPKLVGQRAGPWAGGAAGTCVLRGQGSPALELR